MESRTIRIERSDGAQITLGGDSNWRFIKGGLEGFGDVENDISYVENAISDGVTVTSTRIGVIDRSIDCAWVDFDSNETARTYARNFFNAKHKFKMYVTYMNETRWADCYLAKISLPLSDVKQRLELHLTFTFPSPYWKSNDDFGQDIASVTAMAGFPYMVTKQTGFTAGRFNFAQIVVIANNGDVDTYSKVVVKSNGDAVNPKIIINGKYVRMIDTLHDGDEVVMDFTSNPPTVRKNGTNAIGKCDRLSSFDEMTLVIGDSEVQFTADSGSDVLHVSLYYNELFFTI